MYSGLEAVGIRQASKVYWNLTPSELVHHAIANQEGVLTSTGALMCDTGQFTGRSPQDKFFVKDELTADKIWWGDANRAIDKRVFDRLLHKMVKFVADKDLYVRDVYACADASYQTNIRVINTKAYHNLFVNNMFLRPDVEDLQLFKPEYTILCVPEFEADPAKDGTPHANFAIIDLTEKMIIIGGTGYTGEIKKGVFSILNFVLPLQRNTMPMHCSANTGTDGDTAIFFGLSGTGKTTLSADPNRKLIGDDEHGWTPTGIFNFEGGCYAKVINITREQEPKIWDAIKAGAVLENTRFLKGTDTVDYADKTVTENTRVSYPIDFIPNAQIPSVGDVPKNIFFLTADAYGVLPPISKLNTAQAMFHFISGYTAKVAGTEVGITEPKTVFSTCFGAPFMPLHPTVYAEFLGNKLSESGVNVWLVNTGWTGGGYGTGKRMKLAYTRAMITAALNGDLEKVDYETHPVFGVQMPLSCPEVPAELLNPRNTWTDKAEYDHKANYLAKAFLKNFEKFSSLATEQLLSGAPCMMESSS
ncbi:phosphoenolpyruvate carboxykinase (ATP) [Flexibacter flexilis DSM 6793]|uniref:Phosphoenolpyruvate carboxykinase (ATP) n=2 Tax=Flexibacter flexilis TaxID=998 RepID=A0A1I1EG49_9BACT|nr:phosphoenolpyruvate carboxykinase (ATP) [Flexibacter flexilis DSM 6793]